MRPKRLSTVKQIIRDQNWLNWLLIAMVLVLFGMRMFEGDRVDENAKAIEQLRAGICTPEEPR